MCFYFRCEIRPGPEFVLRKYIFRRNNFSAQLYYYSDEECNHVTHYINVKGFVKPVRPNWRTPGGYDTRHFISEIKVIPYTKEKVKTFGKLMRRYCSESTDSSFAINRKFKIYKFTRYRKGSKNNDDYLNDFDCSKLFNFTMNELQLVRVERRFYTTLSEKKGGKVSQSRTELFLGDVSTDMTLRRQYVPTYYQVPLVRAKVRIAGIMVIVCVLLLGLL